MVAPAAFLHPNMMAGILLCAFAGALPGRIDSPLSALLSGFSVNPSGASLAGTDLKLTLALVIIVSCRPAEPSGLMGRTVQSRV
jgi:branched-chain amino acid transport system permease protein